MIAEEIDEPLKIRGRELDKLTMVAACYNCGKNRRKTGSIFWGSVRNYADILIKEDVELFRSLRPAIDALETTRKYEEIGMYNIEQLSKMRLPKTYNSTLVNNYPKI